MIAMTLPGALFVLAVAASSIGLIAWLLAGAPDLQPRSAQRFGAFVREDPGWYPDEPRVRPLSVEECA